jgi:hypothetical protein
LKEPERPFIRPGLTTPRAAAAAGILFSVLFIISLVLVRISIPANPQDAGAWLAGHWQTVRLALNLVPFSGVAFLWFIGVVRDRLGEHHSVYILIENYRTGRLRSLCEGTGLDWHFSRTAPGPWGGQPRRMRSGFGRDGQDMRWRIRTRTWNDSVPTCGSRAPMGRCANF